MAGLKSSTAETFVVQPYRLRGKAWEALQPTRRKGEEDAMEYGHGLARLCTGVAVLAIETAEDVDYCGEPRVVATFGLVPNLVA